MCVSNKPDRVLRGRRSSRSLRTIVASACWLVLLGASLALRAFDDLNAAQKLIYGTAHMSNTVVGQQINYRYRGRIADDPAIHDRVSLAVEGAHTDDRRDLVLEFLSAERRLPLPDFNAFRGNPVIIAMLEHIAQRFGAETGGGVLYFRNRIRDALAKADTRVEQVKLDHGGGKVDATRVVFSPFADDPYLAAKPAYAGALFTITMSAEVPGGVISVAVDSGQNDPTSFEREITIE